MTDVDYTLEKLNNLKPLISRKEELYICKEEKKENALASEDKSWRQVPCKQRPFDLPIWEDRRASARRVADQRKSMCVS